MFKKQAGSASRSKIKIILRTSFGAMRCGVILNVDS